MSRNGVTIWLWRGLLGALALLLLWRMSVMALSDYFFAQGPTGLGQSLAWNPGHAEALSAQAERVLAQDPQGAIQLARQALRMNPADGLAAVVLAQALLANGQAQQADAQARLAQALMPTRVSLLLRLAKYWDQRGRLEQTLLVLGQAMAAKPALAQEFYPNLLRLAESASQRQAFQPFIEDPPPWWDGFFGHLAKRALQLETVTAFAAMRKASNTPLSAYERQVIVERLLLEGQWSEAYLLWVNGLSPVELNQLGGIFNGGFELPLGNQGFDWRFADVKGVKLQRGHSYGIRGEQALQLTFQGREFHFKHLRQLLYLAPGDYEFIARARPDGLRGRAGLSWVLRCAGEPGPVLGISRRFIGSSEWATHRLAFSVPRDACPAQVLSLESQGSSLFEHKLQGAIWFDRLGIRRIRPE